MSNHSESRPPLSPLNEASAHFGWTLADETMRHLESVGILPPPRERAKKHVRVSPVVLMELSAAMRLNAWLERGLGDSVSDEELDAAVSALDDSIRRLTSNSQALDQVEGLPPLAEKMFEIWEEKFAWNGLAELGADLLLDASEANEEEVLDCLADLLWKHRDAAGVAAPGSDNANPA